MYIFVVKHLFLDSYMVLFCCYNPHRGGVEWRILRTPEDYDDNRFMALTWSYQSSGILTISLAKEKW